MLPRGPHVLLFPSLRRRGRPSSPRRRVWSLLLEPKLLHLLQEWRHGLARLEFPQGKRRNHRPWSRGSEA
jgi:hypothetical protein